MAISNRNLVKLPPSMEPPPPVKAAKQWYSSHSGGLIDVEKNAYFSKPIIVNQYMADRADKWPKVIIFQISSEHYMDERLGSSRRLAVCPPCHSPAGNMKFWRTGLVERHIDIPGWLVPYVTLLEKHPESLNFYSIHNSAQALKLYPGVDWYRCRILQMLFIHASLLHNINNIDYFTVRDEGPTHRTNMPEPSGSDPKGWPTAVTTTWPETVVNNVWKILNQLLKENYTHPVQSIRKAAGQPDILNTKIDDHFGEWVSWPKSRLEVGLDRIFYIINPNTAPRVILDMATEARYMTTSEGHIPMCEHTCRTDITYTSSPGSRHTGPVKVPHQLQGGYADIIRQQQTHYHIDELVYATQSILRHEGVLNGKMNQDHSLPLPTQP